MAVDDFRAAGADRMSDREVREFLTNTGVGVLALPAEDAPYVIPMSFGYDGGDHLYFTYHLGESSRKEELTDRADRARFLVYVADSPFNWQSVILTGPIDPVPEEEWADLEAADENAWHPDVVERASAARGLKGYRFTVEEAVGVKHAGLPPGFEPADDGA